MVPFSATFLKHGPSSPDKAGNIWGYLQILDFSEDMHMFYHYTQLAFLCNCCYLKPHPNCYSSRYYQIPGFPEDTDQTRPYQTRPDQIGPDQTRPVSYKDLSPPFLEVKSVNFVFTNYILVHLQASGISGDFVSFFVSYMKPYRSVTSRVMSRWI